MHSGHLSPIPSEEALHHTDGLLDHPVLHPTDASFGHAQFLVEELPSVGEDCPSGSKGNAFECYVGK